MSDYRTAKREMKRLHEPCHDLNVSAARCPFRCAARVTGQPSFTRVQAWLSTRH